MNWWPLSMKSESGWPGLKDSQDERSTIFTDRQPPREIADVLAGSDVALYAADGGIG